MEIKRFKDIKEFAEEKTINRLIYDTMSYEEKRKLKFYIYYFLKEKEQKKDIIWEYLNEPIGSDSYIYTSIMLSSYNRRK